MWQGWSDPHSLHTPHQMPIPKTPLNILNRNQSPCYGMIPMANSRFKMRMGGKGAKEGKGGRALQVHRHFRMIPKWVVTRFQFLFTSKGPGGDGGGALQGDWPTGKKKANVSPFQITTLFLGRWAHAVYFCVIFKFEKAEAIRLG